MKEFAVKIKPLTPIWTGDANRQNTTLRETGIIGSLRWWYEALIRGLGGTACDPTNESPRCKLDHDKFYKAIKNGNSIKDALDAQICQVCQLFGCTGWARKFRLEIVEKLNEEIIFKFIPLREVEDVEWALLNLTLHLIADYGAIGGRIVLKPSDELERQNKPHHQDYGLISIVDSNLRMLPLEQLQKYVKDKRWRNIAHDSFFWVSIQNFWCVNGRYLSRRSYNESSFNKVLGRNESKNKGSELVNPNDSVSIWLAGSQHNSKKVFSFKNPPRTFGFINPEITSFEQMKVRLEDVWGSGNDWRFLKGEEILNCLVQKLMEGLR